MCFLIKIVFIHCFYSWNWYQQDYSKECVKCNHFLIPETLSNLIILFFKINNLHIKLYVTEILGLYTCTLSHFNQVWQWFICFQGKELGYWSNHFPQMIRQGFLIRFSLFQHLLKAWYCTHTCETSILGIIMYTRAENTSRLAEALFYPSIKGLTNHEVQFALVYSLMLMLHVYTS
jgi:hypothetical protein